MEAAQHAIRPVPVHLDTEYWQKRKLMDAVLEDVLDDDTVGDLKRILLPVFVELCLGPEYLPTLDDLQEIVVPSVGDTEMRVWKMRYDELVPLSFQEEKYPEEPEENDWLVGDTRTMLAAHAPKRNRPDDDDDEDDVPLPTAKRSRFASSVPTPVPSNSSPSRWDRLRNVFRRTSPPTPPKVPKASTRPGAGQSVLFLNQFLAVPAVRDELQKRLLEYRESEILAPGENDQALQFRVGEDGRMYFGGNVISRADEDLIERMAQKVVPLLDSYVENAVRAGEAKISAWNLPARVARWWRESSWKTIIGTFVGVSFVGFLTFYGIPLVYWNFAFVLYVNTFGVDPLSFVPPESRSKAVLHRVRIYTKEEKEMREMYRFGDQAYSVTKNGINSVIMAIAQTLVTTTAIDVVSDVVGGKWTATYATQVVLTVLQHLNALGFYLPPRMHNVIHRIVTSLSLIVSASVMGLGVQALLLVVVFMVIIPLVRRYLSSQRPVTQEAVKASMPAILFRYIPEKHKEAVEANITEIVSSLLELAEVMNRRIPSENEDLGYKRTEAEEKSLKALKTIKSILRSKIPNFKCYGGAPRAVEIIPGSSKASSSSSTSAAPSPTLSASAESSTATQSAETPRTVGHALPKLPDSFFPHKKAQNDLRREIQDYVDSRGEKSVIALSQVPGSNDDFAESIACVLGDTSLQLQVYKDTKENRRNFHGLIVEEERYFSENVLLVARADQLDMDAMKVIIRDVKLLAGRNREKRRMYPLAHLHSVWKLIREKIQHLNSVVFADLAILSPNAPDDERQRLYEQYEHDFNRIVKETQTAHPMGRVQKVGGMIITPPLPTPIYRSEVNEPIEKIKDHIPKLSRSDFFRR